MPNLIKFFSIFITLYSVYQLASLAGLFSERSGIANIAIEGNMILAAVIFALIFENINNWTNWNPTLILIISLLISIPLSGLYMSILSHLTNRYLADHIIVGTGMNLLAPALGWMSYNTLTSNPHGNQLYPNIQFPMGNWSINIGGNFDLNWIIISMLILTIIILLISAFFLNHTKYGLRLKSSGENPYALETSGINVARTRTISLFIAGLLSSLAGITFLMKGVFSFTVNGSGFLAIGILILGQYKIIGITIGSILFAILIGFFDTLPTIIGFDKEEIINFTNITKTLPFIIPIIGLMIFKKSFVPESVGKNFKKDQR